MKRKIIQMDSCKRCGELFGVTKRYEKGGFKLTKFCSQLCSAKKDRTYKKCKYCKQLFTALPHTIQKRVFCSPRCRTLFGSEKAASIPYEQKKWLNGRRIVDGYVYIHSNSHPARTHQNGVVEHRLVVEKAIGRYLIPQEIVHHWDENKLNNKLENLCLFKNKSSHNRIHRFAERHGIKVEKLKFEQPWLWT